MDARPPSFLDPRSQENAMTIHFLTGSRMGVALFSLGLGLTVAMLVSICYLTHLF